MQFVYLFSGFLWGVSVSEIIGLERVLSVAPVAGRNLIRPHRKCAFHLLFLQVASLLACH